MFLVAPASGSLLAPAPEVAPAKKAGYRALGAPAPGLRLRSSAKKGEF